MPYAHWTDKFVLYVYIKIFLGSVGTTVPKTTETNSSSYMSSFSGYAMTQRLVETSTVDEKVCMHGWGYLCSYCTPSCICTQLSLHIASLLFCSAISTSYTYLFFENALYIYLFVCCSQLPSGEVRVNAVDTFTHTLVTHSSYLMGKSE